MENVQQRGSRFCETETLHVYVMDEACTECKGLWKSTQRPHNAASPSAARGKEIMILDFPQNLIV